MKIELVDRISSCNVKYDKDSPRLLPEIELHDKTGEALPLSFPIDGKWKVEHECPQCHHTTNFGRDETIAAVHQPHFIRLPYLNKKYFSIQQLQQFEKLFKLLYTKNKDDISNYWMESRRYNSQIYMLYYRCSNCLVDFLAAQAIAYGTMGQDDREGRTINLFQLDEIVCVKIENLKDFLSNVYDPETVFKYLELE